VAGLFVASIPLFVSARWCVESTHHRALASTPDPTQPVPAVDEPEPELDPTPEWIDELKAEAEQ
jgi:hypothetical protein